MEKVHGWAVSKVFFAALVIILTVGGIAQAQTDLPAFTGKFTLTTQVHWDKTILQPGDYTITLGSSSMPSFALVADSKGRPVARFVSRVDGGDARAQCAAHRRTERTTSRVFAGARQSRKSAGLRPALAREAALEARAPRTVPVMLAKR